MSGMVGGMRIRYDHNIMHLTQNWVLFLRSTRSPSTIKEKLEGVLELGGDQKVVDYEEEEASYDVDNVTDMLPHLKGQK